MIILEFFCFTVQRQSRWTHEVSTLTKMKNIKIKMTSMILSITLLYYRLFNGNEMHQSNLCMNGHGIRYIQDVVVSQVLVQRSLTLLLVPNTDSTYIPIVSSI